MLKYTWKLDQEWHSKVKIKIITLNMNDWKFNRLDLIFHHNQKSHRFFSWKYIFPSTKLSAFIDWLFIIIIDILTLTMGYYLARTCYPPSLTLLHLNPRGQDGHQITVLFHLKSLPKVRSWILKLWQFQ